MISKMGFVSQVLMFLTFKCILIDSRSMSSFGTRSLKFQSALSGGGTNVPDIFEHSLNLEEHVINLNILATDLYRGVGLPKLQFIVEEILSTLSNSNVSGKNNKTILCLSFSFSRNRNEDLEKVKNDILFNTREIIEKIWDDVAKPIELVNSKFSDHFDIRLKQVDTKFHNLLDDSTPPLSVDGEDIDVTRYDEYGKVLDVVMSSFVDRFALIEEQLKSIPLDTSALEYGQHIDKAIKDCLKECDELMINRNLGPLLDKDIRDELVLKLLDHLEPLFRDKLQTLHGLSWSRMQQGLVNLRAGDPAVLKKMEICVNDADNFFKQTSERMTPGMCQWSSERERRVLMKKMRKFVNANINNARVQGSFVQGAGRVPISFSLHYLQNPMSMFRFVRNGFKHVLGNGGDLLFSYHEDTRYNPTSPDTSSVVSKLPLPFGSMIAKTASKLTAVNERR